MIKTKYRTISASAPLLAILLSVLSAAGEEAPDKLLSIQYTETNPEAFPPPPVYERHGANDQAAVHAGGFYMRAQGRGELFQIARYMESLGAEMPLFKDTYMTVSGNTWQEQTLRDRQTHRANGMTAELTTSPLEYLSSTVRWTTKRYDEEMFRDTDSGSVTLSANLRDCATASAGFERSDEIYNYFGMLQGIQSDNWWIHLSSDITRRLEVSGTARYRSYNDSNNGIFFRTSAGYAFTDYPRIFKVSIAEEYRDTRDNYLALYFQDFAHLANIIHPYWCPRDYTAQTLTFEWNHTLSASAPIPVRQHFYTIRASFSIDSDSNPAAQVSGKWYYELGTHLTAGVSAMLYRSKEWDAESATAEVSYWF